MLWTTKTRFQIWCLDIKLLAFQLKECFLHSVTASYSTLLMLGWKRERVISLSSNRVDTKDCSILTVAGLLILNNIKCWQSLWGTKCYDHYQNINVMTKNALPWPKHGMFCQKQSLLSYHLGCYDGVWFNIYEN